MWVKCCHKECREARRGSGLFFTEWVEFHTAHDGRTAKLSNAHLHLCMTFEKKSTASHAVEDYKWKRTRVCTCASKVCSFQSKLHTLPKFSISWTRKSLWFLSPFMKWPTWSLWTSGTISSPAACLSQGKITVVGESLNVSCSCTPVRILNHKPSPEPLP